MSEPLALVVGLGYPGQRYQHTRHNAGVMFLERLCAAARGTLRPESKFHGLCGRIELDGCELRLLFPTTFMNNSGQAVAAIAQYYKITAQRILVAYDELDLPVGTTRLKKGGGHGGHNGVRDIIKALDSADFLRLRLGIGHPGAAPLVLNYVLCEPSRADQSALEAEFDKALTVMPLLAQGKVQQAMTQLHTKT